MSPVYIRCVVVTIKARMINALFISRAHWLHSLYVAALPCWRLCALQQCAMRSFHVVSTRARRGRHFDVSSALQSKIYPQCASGWMSFTTRWGWAGKGYGNRRGGRERDRERSESLSTIRTLNVSGISSCLRTYLYLYLYLYQSICNCVSASLAVAVAASVR